MERRKKNKHAEIMIRLKRDKIERERGEVR
jgi:hypothetical protein